MNREDKAPATMVGSQAFREVACPLCDAVEVSVYVWAPSHYGSDKLRVTRCGVCGMIFTNPQATDYEGEVEQRGALDRHFNATKLDVDRHNARLQLTLLSRFAPRGNLLDFGCGAGVLVQEALTRGWSATGLDLNRGLVNAANARWRFSVLRSGSLDEFIKTQPPPFHAILSNQVFEHLQRPVELGVQLVSLLRPGGVLYLDVPYAHQPGEWFARGRTFDPTSHWNHFSRRTICYLCERLGLEVLFCSASPAMVGIWRRLGIGDLSYRLGCLCKMVFPPLGSGVCAIARKPAG